MKPKFSADGLVKFYEKSHKYRLGKKELVSGTTFLKPFFSKFDQKDVARKIAKGFASRNNVKRLQKIKVTPEEKKKATMKYWINEWNEASAHGTRVHFLLEQFIRELNNDELQEICSEDYESRDLNKYGVGSYWIEKELDLIEEPELYPEYIIYNKDLGIAGQIDLKVIDARGVTHLYDWKTNKEIKQTGSQCNEPISEFKDCHYVKYMLQLSLYAYMEELKGAIIGKLCIVHLTEEGAVPYEVEYQKEIIERLLNYVGRN